MVTARAWLRHELKRMQPSDAGTLPGVKKVLPCALKRTPEERCAPERHRPDIPILSQSRAEYAKLR